MPLHIVAKALALVVGAFVFFTAAFGALEGLIQRAVFLGLVVSLGYALYPLGAGKRWRPVGLAADLALVAVSLAGCAYVVVNYDRIMNELPWATPLDLVLCAGLVLGVLELSRRTVGLIFPVLVVAGLAYAYFGPSLPGAMRHRGFDAYYITETVFLGDLGIWGMLTGVAATVIAAFVLFGALLLHTGGGKAFIDLAMRLGGRQAGGAAKIATIASGLFGMISGSSVANVATTGNFTIPMMIRLGYPRPFAAAVEAVASTGGQIAPPIMGAAAFVMAEIVEVPYSAIIKAALLPAILFYISVFVTVHFVALRRGLALVPDDELPPWAKILAPRQIGPVLMALTGLGIGFWLGRSVATSAFYGVVGLLIAFVATQAGQLSARDMAGRVIAGLEDAGRGLVIVGVLLAGAQVLVSMVNLTGAGVALSSSIVSLGGDSLWIVAMMVGIVCLVMGMGLPTTAAYVLVAAVLAPALTEVGVPVLTAHLFVFYFATISVITPPVCVAVFVGAGIAQTNWMPAAMEAVRLAAITYLLPFLLLLYPGMVLEGGALAILDAALAGVLLVFAIPALLTRIRITRHRMLDRAVLVSVIVLAAWPNPFTPFLAAGILLAAWGSTRLTRKVSA
ncbi:TRAP transporter fused permease subunit [Arenibacterium halophilum]|uniref:TRAP transporter fused permease subunit n=1 Tax=Arenibacterium halophilum TaxID=2583821 RepID=A0ABY2WZQ8_9RHOB|nr:TRAP transporter fused permease subunit [Arenibacterium halophilum]